MTRSTALAALALAAAACGSVRPWPPSPLDPECNLGRYLARDLYSQWYEAGKVPRAARAEEVNVLALSAGGEFGAYGAGFLAGWRKVGPEASPIDREDIQVVTGVSTGAIMATHAFLGQAEDDAFLEEMYTHLEGRQIYRTRGTLELLKANSLYDAWGKDQLIRDHIDAPLVERVAREFETGRRLYIGTVDLDSGEFLRVDMVALAHAPELSPEQRLACYRAVIGASSAIPVAFPPVYVDRRMLVDGGVRWHLFLTEPCAGTPGATPDQLRRCQEQKDRVRTWRLFGLVHGDLQVPTVVPDPKRKDNGVLSIAERTMHVTTDQGVRSSAQWLDAIARGMYGGPAYQVRFASAARAAGECEREGTLAGCTGLEGDDMFCKPFMQCLARKGREDGEAYASGDRPWMAIDDVFPPPQAGAPGRSKGEEGQRAPARRFP